MSQPMSLVQCFGVMTVLLLPSLCMAQTAKDYSTLLSGDDQPLASSAAIEETTAAQALKKPGNVKPGATGTFIEQSGSTNSAEAAILGGNETLTSQVQIGNRNRSSVTAIDNNRSQAGVLQLGNDHKSEVLMLQTNEAKLGHVQVGNGAEGRVLALGDNALVVGKKLIVKKAPIKALVLQRR